MSRSMTDVPAVSVVVATRNRASRLRALLESLERQDLSEPYEILVVDDGSDDDTEAVLEEFSTRLTGLRFVSQRPSRGPAAARNEGIELASSSLVAFTDDDCVAKPDWLSSLVSATKANEAAVVQGVTRPDPSELHRVGPFSHTRDVDGTGPWFETCNIAYPRELLERLGGFDTSFPEPLGEDTDLGWRALALGAERVRAPNALVYHAVDDLGWPGHLKLALRGADGVLVFKRHPELRRSALKGGVLRNPAHARLILALAASLLARRRVTRLLFATPYVRQLLWRCRMARAVPFYAAYYVLFDCLSLYTTIRGDLRHRIFIV